MPDPMFEFDDERLEWYMMTPLQRLVIYEQMFQFYLEMGGSLDPDYDPQSPFNNLFFDKDRNPIDGREDRRKGLNIVRGGGI
jgi:hypothetical protein